MTYIVNDLYFALTCSGIMCTNYVGQKRLQRMTYIVMVQLIMLPLPLTITKSKYEAALYCTGTLLGV
jgi:hypothetical protein